ncbi:unnamed protein product, partial [Amoebophrya sp. A25]|eukprot:GSA25T00018013001.1
MASACSSSWQPFSWVMNNGNRNGQHLHTTSHRKGPPRSPPTFLPTHDDVIYENLEAPRSLTSANLHHMNHVPNNYLACCSEFDCWSNGDSLALRTSSSSSASRIFDTGRLFRSTNDHTTIFNASLSHHQTPDANVDVVDRGGGGGVHGSASVNGGSATSLNRGSASAPAGVVPDRFFVNGIDTRSLKSRWADCQQLEKCRLLSSSSVGTTDSVVARYESGHIAVVMMPQKSTQSQKVRGHHGQQEDDEDVVHDHSMIFSGNRDNEQIINEEGDEDETGNMNGVGKKTSISTSAESNSEPYLFTTRVANLRGIVTDPHGEQAGAAVALCDYGIVDIGDCVFFQQPSYKQSSLRISDRSLTVPRSGWQEDFT